MPLAAIATIADAVVAVLNAEQFSQAFTAMRTYLPVFDLAEMQDLHVTVVPKRISSQSGDRSRRQFDYDIDVGVQKKLQGTENDEIDALVGLVDEIADRFRSKRLDGHESAVCLQTEVDPVYAREHLDTYRQFTSVLTLTFRIMR